MKFTELKQKIYLDGCTDLARGMACLRWSLAAGKTYEEAVIPWKRDPDLFSNTLRVKRQNERHTTLHRPNRRPTAGPHRSMRK